MQWCRQFVGLVVVSLLPAAGFAQVVIGPGGGGTTPIQFIEPTGTRTLDAFPGFLGGMSVTLGDVTGDGVADVIAGAGPGGGPHVRVFSGTDLTELANFYAFDPAFGGGVRVAAGDVDGDGLADIIAGAGPGGGPHVRVFSGGNLSELASFYAYDPTFTGGVTVAAGDVDGDGRADIVTGAGAGGGPHVRVLSGLDLSELASFYAYDPAFELVLQPELNSRLEWFKGQRAQGTWTLTIRDDATGDGGTLNGWSLIVVEEEPLADGTPRTIFSTDFESNDGGFTHSGTQDEWEWGAPASAPIATANSGVNAWKTDLDNSYNNNSNQDLFSPEIDLTGVTSGAVLLQWAMKFQLEPAQFDYAFVEIQESGGAGRTRKLWEWLGADMVANIGNPVITLQEAAGWGRYRALVNDFFGKRIRLRFHLQTDNSVQRAGLAIDDVSVTAFER